MRIDAGSIKSISSGTVPSARLPLATSTDKGAVPIYYTQTLDLAGSGNYTAGLVTFTRIGNVVTYVTHDVPEHSLGGGPGSATGFIPSIFLPVKDMYNVNALLGDGIYASAIYADGRFRNFYRNYSGAYVNRVDGAIAYTGSYIII